jgi:hypothetical protein
VQGFHDTPLLYLALKRTPGNLDRVYFEGDVGRVTIGLNRHFAQVSGGNGAGNRDVDRTSLCMQIGGLVLYKDQMCSQP